MSRKSIFATAAFAVAAAFAAPASAAVITFEEFAQGTIINNQYAGLGLTISVTNNRANAAFDYGVIFDTSVDPSTVEDIDLLAPFDDLSTADDEMFMPGNVLIIQEDNGVSTCSATVCSPVDDEGEGGVVRFDWTSEVTVNSFDYFDIEAGEAMLTVVLFDLIGNIISTTQFNGSGGDNTFATAMLGVGGVGAMEVFFNSSGALDNISFDASEVPLPGAIVFMGAGLAAYGARRKKAKSA